MRSKNRGATPERGPEDRCVRADLERRGVSPEMSGPVAERLMAIAADLSPTEYAAVLDGLASAHRSDSLETPDPALRSREFHRLIHDFTVELKKLDEALQLLSAYVLRLRESAPQTGWDKLH